MDDIFTLTVSYKGKEAEYEGQLFVFGYSYRIRMRVDGSEVDYERDEEGAFRASLPFDADGKTGDTLDKDLLAAIAEKLEQELA